MPLEDGVSKVTFTIRDAKGAIGKASFWLHFYRPSYEPPDDWLVSLCDQDWHLSSYCQLLAENLDAFIKGKIESIHYTVPVALPTGLKTVPDPDSDVEEGAVIEYTTVDSHQVSQRIPTFDHALFGAATEINAIYEDNPELYDWIWYQILPSEQQYEYRQEVTDNRGTDLFSYRTIRKIFRPRKEK